MSYTLQPIPANTTFGQKKRYGSSDYISDKKSKLNICAFKKQCLRLAGKGKYGWSSQAYTDFNKVKNNNSFFDFSQLYAGLYTILDFKSNDTNNNPVEIIKNNITGESPTTIIPKDKMCVPYYQVYSIDPNGSLFGRTPCGYLNYMNFVRFKLQNKICVNVPPKHEPLISDCDTVISGESIYTKSENCDDKSEIIDAHIVECETVVSCSTLDNSSVVSHNTFHDSIEICHDIPNENNQNYYYEQININDYSKDDWFAHILNPGFENYIKNYEEKLEEEEKIKEELNKK